MFEVTLANILALCFSFLDSRKMLKNGLAYAFIIVTVIAAIRYDYGNDYMSYMRDFNRVGQYSFLYIIEYQELLQYVDAVFKDLGAVLIFRIFHPLGFFFFAGIVSVCMNAIYYQFIKENVKREYLWIAMFLYLFQFEFYVLPMSMIRQGLSIALLVWTWHFIKEDKIIVPILIAILSISIHKSAVVVIPFLLIARYYKFQNGKFISLILIICVAVMFASSKLLNSIFESIAGADAFKIYVNSYGDESTKSIGLIRMILIFIPFLLAIYYLPKSSLRGDKTIVCLSTIGVLILPFTSIIALISRLCFYFNIYTIAAIPISLTAIKNKVIRYSLCALLLVATAYQYYDIFLHSVYTNSFIHYQTIFSAP